MSTRERILDSALALFNEKGTSAISTNHIAAAIGISPGNLYYHFRNKEDIIAALFERLFEMWDKTYQLPAGRAPSLADFENLIAANFHMIWEFRFAYRELAVLLRQIPALHGRYQDLRTRGYAGFSNLIEAFAEAGVISTPETPQEMQALTDLCWIVSEQWPVDLELRGQPFDEAGIQSGIMVLRHIFRPYLDRAGHKDGT
jgi:AcrR family transcriptional regulator